MAIAAFFALWENSAQAQSLDEALSARSIGRAGTATVSGDSGAALLYNPGAMIRRSQPRLVLSGQLFDADLRYENSSSSPSSINRAAPVAAPLLAYHHGNERGTWVLGAVLSRGRYEASHATPVFGQPPDDISQLFPHRYGGTYYKGEQQTLALGGALRIGEYLGVGFSLSASQYQQMETRRIWAGFDGRDSLLSPENDLELSLDGKDDFVPGASVGFLIAPPEIPLEFALSGQYISKARLNDSKVDLISTQPVEFPRPDAFQAHGSLLRSSSFTLRAGIRYLAERSSIEVGADLSFQGKISSNDWQLQNLAVTDESGLAKELLSVNSLRSQRNHLALRAAYDYEAILGFLWLTAGYSFTSPAVSADQYTPVYTKLGGHTGAIGIEAYYDRFTLNFGFSRRFARSRSLIAENASQEVVNPFDAGTGPLGVGKYTSSLNRVGVSLELSWP